MIQVAKHAGFCYGVSRAVKTAIAEAGKGPLCSLGPIVHNDIVTQDLELRGVRVVDNINDVDEGCRLLIRAHGVPPEIYRDLHKYGISYIDCTCPDVKKIHNIAKAVKEEGKTLIVAGDPHHPEVIGIVGYASPDVFVIESVEDLKGLPLLNGRQYALVAQTTFRAQMYDQIINALPNCTCHYTICAATANRQREAELLSLQVDAMIVLGDAKSSNTSKLYEICKKNCENTVFIEKIEDLLLNISGKNVRIGITAGASTPPVIIKEALLKMSELENQNHQTFEEMINESIVTLHTGDVVKGTVISVSNGEVSVNLSYKSDGLIPRNEYSDDPTIEPGEQLAPGDEIEVFVVRVNDGEGNVLLSKKKIDTKKNMESLEGAYIDKTPVKGIIVDVIKGGLIALIKGVRAFVPASQISNRYVAAADLPKFKDKEFDFLLIEFEKGKRRVVAGRRELAAQEEQEKKEKVFSALEPGTQVDGVVSRIVEFGAFVDLGGVDGLVHISELSWGRVKHVKDVLAEGDSVRVTVLALDKNKGRISLSLKDINNDPWHNVAEKYAVGSIVEGVVVRLAPFGAFVELEDGVDGLVHISQIAAKHVVKPEDELAVGDRIQAKVTEVDPANNRISLSKKDADGALAEPIEADEDIPKTEEPNMDEPAEETNEN